MSRENVTGCRRDARFGTAASTRNTHKEVNGKMADFEITRRDFNKGLAGAAVGMLASAGPIAQSVLGANDRIAVGLIGPGGMAQPDLKHFLPPAPSHPPAIPHPSPPH